MAVFVRRELDREFSRDERLPGVEYTKRNDATTKELSLFLSLASSFLLRVSSFSLEHVSVRSGQRVGEEG